MSFKCISVLKLVAFKTVIEYLQRIIYLLHTNSFQLESYFFLSSSSIFYNTYSILLHLSEYL